MAHVTPALLIDLAEGTCAESSVAHLAECDTCRRALADLRATMSDAVDAEMPEPSPLFWDHLSARVRESVAQEPVPGRARWPMPWLQPRVVIPVLGGGAAVAAVAIVLVAVSLKPPTPHLIPATPLPVVGETVQLPSLPPLEPFGAADDPSLGLMADYGTTLAWDDMREEMALVTHIGGTDEAVIALSVEEQRELQRLLQEEMTQPSALGAS